MAEYKPTERMVLLRNLLVITFFIVLSSTCIFSNAIASPNEEWKQQFSQLTFDVARSVQQTSDGGYVIIGYTRSDPAGPADARLIKTDANGDEIWNKTIGGSSDDKAYSIQQTSDDGYIIAGYTESYRAGLADAWLIKTDANGDEIWNKTFGGAYNDKAYSVQQTSDDGYIIAGYTESYGAGSADIWLIKTDVNGDEIWKKTFGGAYNDKAYSVQQTSDGGYIIAGYVDTYTAWLIKADSNGILEWEWEIEYKNFYSTVFSVKQLSTGGYIVAGYIDLDFTGNFDIWLIKIDPNGDEIWSKTFGESNDDNDDKAYSVQETSDGGFIIAGYTESYSDSADAWLIKTDPNGGEIWNKTFGDSSYDDKAYSVLETSDGGYIIAGNKHTDAWLIKLSNDNESPTARCKYITIELDSVGSAGITAEGIDDGSYDNCGIASMDVFPNAFTCNDVGLNMLTLLVKDFSENVSACTGLVMVQENEPPIAKSKDITIQLDSVGSAGITAEDIDDGSYDNCGIASMTVSPDTFTYSEVGPNTVTLLVTDLSGNEGTCTATVTVREGESPVAKCKDISIQVDSVGSAGITAEDIDDGSSDNCGIASMTVSPDTFSFSEVGPNTVSLLVTDLSGNEGTCTATVTVREGESPVAKCKDITIQLGSGGSAGISAEDIDDGSSDNCGIASKKVVPKTFTCNDVGLNTVTLLVTDLSGNKGTCTATVTVREDKPPVAKCKDIVIRLNSVGSAGITAEDIDDGSSDNCGIASMTVSPDTFSFSDVGPNMVTLTVIDLSGNEGTCTALVLVREGEPPVAKSKDITIQLDSGGSAGISAEDIDDGSSDNCGIASMTVSPNTFTCNDVGPNTVTLTGRDFSGNEGTCTAIVMVREDELPIAKCKDITVQMGSVGSAGISAEDIDDGSSDNCGIDSMVISLDTFTCADVGPNMVTLTGRDLSGNEGTCTAKVMVREDELPIAKCKDITIQMGFGGSAGITAEDIDDGSSDNCGIASMTVSPNIFTCADVGPNTVTLTVTDLSGNEGTCTATVTVRESELPIAKCKDITIQLDSGGSAGISAEDIDDGSSDNCGIDSMVISPDTFTCADEGPNTVTLIVTDLSGNEGTCTATVTVQEDESPVAKCKDITIQLDSGGSAGISAEDIDDGSSDNCAIDSMVISPDTFTCADVGPNTVTLTVTDLSGNEGTCTAIVMVREDELPIAKCKDITIQMGSGGSAGISAEDIDDGSSDNCGISSMTVSPNIFTCADVGPNTVTLTVTDLSGNEGTCTAIVMVREDELPIAKCKDITIQMGSGGSAGISAEDIDGGSSDNCGIASMTVSPNIFTCADVGSNTVTLTVTDLSGNEGTHTAIVNVKVINNQESNNSSNCWNDYWRMDCSLWCMQDQLPSFCWLSYSGSGQGLNLATYQSDQLGQSWSSFSPIKLINNLYQPSKYFNYEHPLVHSNTLPKIESFSHVQEQIPDWDIIIDYQQQQLWNSRISSELNYY